MYRLIEALQAGAGDYYLPSDCVPDRGDGEPAGSWSEVVAVAEQHADGFMGVLEGFRMESDR